MSRLVRFLDICLQAITLTLLIGLAVVVVLGVAYRYLGLSLIWYDEVASMLLAWLTFTGAALAAGRNAHLGFNGLLFGLPHPARVALFFFVEAVFVATFAVIAWAGWGILEIFGDDTLTTLRWLPRAVVQSVLPISAVLIILTRVLTIPQRFANLLRGYDPDTEEIEQEIARAREEMGLGNAETGK